MALFRPLLARLDGEHSAAGGELAAALAWLYGPGRTVSDSATGPLDGLAAADPRFVQPLGLMRQAFAREATAGAAPLFQRWSDLHNHLRFAYVPAGRALLAIHSEASIAEAPLDALTIAIGLTATLQEAPQRFRDGGPILLPVQWFPAGTAIDRALAGRRRDAGLTAGYAVGLRRLEEMLDLATSSARAVHNDALRHGLLASVFLMRRLSRRLLRRPPNIRPVTISPLDRLLLRWRS